MKNQFKYRTLLLLLVFVCCALFLIIGYPEREGSDVLVQSPLPPEPPAVVLEFTENGEWIEKIPNQSEVKINSASVNDIAMALQGVGVHTARRIVEYREENGPYNKLDDLEAVKGIGPATLEKNKQVIVFDNVN